METTATTSGQRVRRIGKAIVSDLSLHGITYLGVLVVFASILGLLLFSFAEIPNEQQPFYELGMASVFFAFAWYLRRHDAKHAATAMELVGGMTLPLVLYAGLVDDAPFPPDFHNGTLIVVMVATALGLSLVYRLISQNNQRSVLGYLVAPLWWLAALVAGFAFKTDEALTGDAITRLVTAQPAIAAAAVAMTLLALPGISWARKPGVVAVPAAYLLTLALASGESWEPTLALLVAGVATMVSVEILARGTRAERTLPAFRPFLLAGVLLPLLPEMESHLFGVVLFATYLAVHELTLRTTGSTGALVWTRLGIAAGAILAWADPWSSLAVFSSLTAWGVYRLSIADESDAGEYEAIAAFAPIGVAHGLLDLMPAADAYAVMTGVVVIVALAGTRFRHRMLTWWPTGASVLVAVGVISSFVSPLPVTGATALVVTGAVVVLTDRSSLIRFWFAAIVYTFALVGQFDRFPNPDDVAALTLAVVGGLIVAGSVWRHDKEALNVSYFGLLLTLVAGLVGGPGWTALAFGLISARAAVSAGFLTGPWRNVNQAGAVASAAAAWLTLIRYLDLEIEPIIEWTGLVWGAAALAVALAGRFGLVRRDWVWSIGAGSVFLLGAFTLLTLPGYGYEVGVELAIGVALLAIATEVSWRQTHDLFRASTPLVAAASWFIGVRALEPELGTALWATAVASGLAIAVIAEVERRQRANPIVLASRILVPAIVLIGAWAGSLALREVAVGIPVSAGIALAGLGTGRLARPLDMPGARVGASLLWAGAVLNLGWAIGWSARELAIVSAVAGAVSVLAYLMIWRRDHDTGWAWPLLGVALLADFVAVGVAMSLFPDQGVGVAVSLSIATQTLAGGIILTSPGLLTVAPPAAAAGFLFAIGDTLSSHVSWWTVPLGLVGLAEIEILRDVRRRRDVPADTTGSIVMETVSGAVIVAPALASLFTEGLVFAAVALAAAVAGMLWGVVTRLRRRVYAAAGVALATAVLTLVAAAASTAPETVGFWVTGAGIGLTVLLLAGYAEAYRNRRGAFVARLDHLMEGWE